MIDEKKLDDLARIIALASMDIFKGNAYREEERKLARDIWINGIIVGEEKDKAETRDKDLEEVIIKIPKKQYDTIKSDLYNTFPTDMRKWGLEAIRNGTLIPEGHGKLLDANAISLHDIGFLSTDDYLKMVNKLTNAAIIKADANIEADKIKDEVGESFEGPEADDIER